MAIKQTDADSLLKQLSKKRTSNRRGQLKIYFGYAAGVGKTYTMLEDAQAAKKDGIDVVVGYIEPHARTETIDLMKGLECLPPKNINYKGVSLRELDIDKALKRKPQLILVDELAHTNAEGCRHKKRYQDVDELLKAGIDVYTTVNVQHIESLHDVVASITGVSVNERIPDSVFDSADQIELIDIEPAELIDRLNKGKIYNETQARRALENFFTKRKLLALREIALRRTADQVTRIEAKDTGQDWEYGKEYNPFGNEHILVCISASRSDAKVIRSAARIADAMHGTFTALYVETGSTEDLDAKELSIIRDNLRLSEQLGAQISTVYGENIAEQISEYAKASRVTKIVVGRSVNKRRHFFKYKFVDKLSDLTPNMDIYIIPDVEPTDSHNPFRGLRHFNFSIGDSVKTLVGLAACTLISFGFFHLGFSDSNIITIFILGVLLNAMVTKGWGYGLAYSVLSVLIINFFFTEPSFSLKIDDSGYSITFIVMLIASMITSTLTRRVKNQASQSAQKAHRTEILLETNRRLEAAKSQDDILDEIARQLIKLLSRSVIIYADKDNELEDPKIFPMEKGFDMTQYLSSDERAVAEWVYNNNKRAGATTNTLSAAKCLYLAVRSGNNVLAVVGIVMDKGDHIETFEKNLMVAMLGECAMALEKLRANEAGRQIIIEAKQERLRATLLRSISHDLRTPLTSITGNVGMLLSKSGTLSEGQKTDLYSDIYDDSMWLNNIVENLLSITRLEKENVDIDMEPELLSDVIREALKHISRQKSEHNIKVMIQDEFLMARMDVQLIIQVIVNLVDNAIKYTQPGSNIIISAGSTGNVIQVEVSDDGPGIKDEEKANLFDMFYTANEGQGDAHTGLGLGLYLCKNIVAAHGGEIYVRDNKPKGTVIGFTLKSQEVDIHE